MGKIELKIFQKFKVGSLELKKDLKWWLSGEKKMA